MKKIILLLSILGLLGCKSVPEEDGYVMPLPANKTQDLIDFSAQISNLIGSASDDEFILRLVSASLPDEVRTALNSCEVKNTPTEKSNRQVKSGNGCPLNSSWMVSQKSGEIDAIVLNANVNNTFQNYMGFTFLRFTGERTYNHRSGRSGVDSKIEGSFMRFNGELGDFSCKFSGREDGSGYFSYEFASRMGIYNIKATISNSDYGFINNRRVTFQEFARRIPIIR